MLGKRMLEERRRKSLSQEELAAKVGVSPSYISQIERGTRAPSYGLLQEISAHLGVSVSYLVGGDPMESEDPTERLVNSAVRFLDSTQRNKVLEYIEMLTGSRVIKDFPLFDSPAEYAQYLLRRTGSNSLPVDPFLLAEKLGVEVVSGDCGEDCEAILRKGGEKPLVILSSGVHEPRRRFSLAMLLGHVVIPWHVRAEFRRRRIQRSLEVQDQLDIESREFAGALLLPPRLLQQDFASVEPGISVFEELADKYGSSMLSVAQRYVESHPKTSALLTWTNGALTRAYPAGFERDVVKRLVHGSLAYELTTATLDVRTIRQGFVEPTAWLVNPVSGLKVYEESLLDPAFGTGVTFLQFRR